MSKRRSWILFAVGAVAVGTWGLWFARGNKGAAADIQRLADLAGRNDDAAFKKEAEALARKYQKLGVVMRLFKERTEKDGGLGVGKNKGAIEPDGIEAKAKSLAKQAPTATELEQQEEDLVRMTQVTAAIAEVARHKCEVTKKVGYLDPKDWKRWLDGMQQSSLELAEAVKARDGGRVKAAAGLLSSYCTNCHRIFRE
jgi:hypothetical protein